MYFPPKNDPAYSQWRLDKIMTRRRLNFNPYTVSDERLMEIVNTTGWGNEFDIVQITSVIFTRLREVKDYREYDGIYMRNATDPDEIFIREGSLIYPISARDTIKQERTWVGNRPLTRSYPLPRLVGKRYFVSRTISGANFRDERSYTVAYRFHRIKGKLAQDAAMIREAMCAAKIEMLERILAHPESMNHLSCSKGLIDYESRILRAIERIRHFHEVKIPKS